MRQRSVGHYVVILLVMKEKVGPDKRMSTTRCNVPIFPSSVFPTEVLFFFLTVTNRERSKDNLSLVILTFKKKCYIRCV